MRNRPDPDVRILQHGRAGYVAYEQRSALFEVAFPTSPLRLDEQDLRFFAGALDDRIHAHPGRVCPGAKLFIFDHGDTSIRLALGLAEMEVLHDMVEDALMTRAVDQVMDDL